MALSHRETGGGEGVAFQRARFGKYEKRQKRMRWVARAGLLVVGAFLAWFVWESARALTLFQ